MRNTNHEQRVTEPMNCNCEIVGETDTGTLELSLCERHAEAGHIYVDGEAWARSDR